MTAVPKVSCLMPTRDRFALFQRSLACYLQQTYPHRELVIASEGDANYQRQLAEAVAALGREDVRCVFVEGSGWNLGKMRNLTIDHARGDLICQWDDDDLHHPQRLERQVEALLREEALACYLTEQLQFFEERNELYWTDWAGGLTPEQHPGTPVVPGTVLCRKTAPARYPEAGPHSACYEDMIFMQQLFAAGPVARHAGEAYLYIYTYHGANIFPFEHHWRIIGPKGVDSTVLRSRRERLQAELDRYGWFRSPVRVCGWDGLAFVYTPASQG